MIRAAILAALLLLAATPADATAPRPAPDPTALLRPVDLSGAGERASDPTRAGAPPDEMPTMRPGGAPSPPAASDPARDARAGGDGAPIISERTPTPSARPSGVPMSSPATEGGVAWHGSSVSDQTRGIASYVAPRYGRWYLALPGGPDIHVRICGAGCIERVSTDAGPDRAMQRAGRIADLSWWDWQTVCGLDPSRGLCPVSVEVVR